jgi:NAD(P)-dependent dehydrogenase (short-subunit alcohol dehydrogenase family)
VIVVVAAAANAEVSELANRLGELGRVILLAAQPPPGLSGATAVFDVDPLSAISVGDAWRVAEKQHGPADALVSVPAPASQARIPFPETSDALWSSAMADLTCAMHAARAAARAMTSRGRGRIILVSWRLDDGAGRVPLATASGSISLLARALAAEVGPGGVTVNAVAVAPGRLADVQPVVRYLCSPDSGYLTAEILALGETTAGTPAPR